jgi:hypothetical protein
MKKIGETIKSVNSGICGRIVGSYTIKNNDTDTNDKITKMGEVTENAFGYIVKAFSFKCCRFPNCFRNCVRHFRDDLYYISETKSCLVTTNTKLDEIFKYILYIEA